MSGKIRAGAVVGLLVLVGIGIGCASKPSPRTAADAAPAAAGPETTVVPPAGDSTAAEKDITSETLPGSIGEISGYLKDTFFDFDRADLRADQREVLSADAAWLKKWPSVKVRVEGHCDERGTSQYNLALGERRAESVREYMVSLGIDPGRIEVVSYGKERPFNRGHDEAAWAQNRRGHFVVTAR